MKALTIIKKCYTVYYSIRNNEDRYSGNVDVYLDYPLLNNNCDIIKSLLHEKVSEKFKEEMFDGDFLFIEHYEEYDYSDIVLHNGKPIARYLALNEIVKEKIINSIENSNYDYFYIQEGYVGNSCLLWRQNSQGRTTDLNKAQLYSKDYIIKFIKSDNKMEYKYIPLEEANLAKITTIESQQLKNIFTYDV